MEQKEEPQKTHQEKKVLYHVIKFSVCNKLMMY